ncbi:MAG: hypothetical protein R3C01_13415 [Planctomycetaceae bacterium]
MVRQSAAACWRGTAVLMVSGLVASGMFSRELFAADADEAVPAVRLVEAKVVEETKEVEATEAADEADGDELGQLADPTHKQVRKIVVKQDGHPASLTTFCLDADGNILACISSRGGAYGVPPAKAAEKPMEGAAPVLSYVQKYSPEGDLLAAWPLEFNATAINVAADRTIFVAGMGRIARLSDKGELLTVADTPNQSRSEEDAAAELAQAKEANAKRIELFERQLEIIGSSVAKIEEIPADERTARDTAKLELYERQQTIYKQQIELLRDPKNVTRTVSSRSKTVTALALSEKHLFVCCGSSKGSGYDVWRCDFDFQNAKSVMSGLGGCCGQCDIQALADGLVVAENTRFRVGVYDVDGKSVTSFGDRDRTSKAGFGSCCNPMNVRCASNGDIITAESSIGNIKRFGADGKFKTFIGKAKVSGGCKHVAVSWDEKRDRYYLMNITDQSICVMVPKAEAPEFTEDELAAKEAREGLGKKLVGKWSIITAADRAEAKAAAEAGAAKDGEDSATGTVVAEGQSRFVVTVVEVNGQRIITRTTESTQDVPDSTEGSTEATSAPRAEVTEAAPKKSTALGRVIGSLLGADTEAPAVREVNVPNALFHEIELFADGRVVLSGGTYGRYGLSGTTWEPIQQGPQGIEIDVLSDGVQFFRLNGKFENDNEVTLGLSSGGSVQMAHSYRREQTKPAATKAATANIEVRIDAEVK